MFYVDTQIIGGRRAPWKFPVFCPEEAEATQTHLGKAALDPAHQSKGLLWPLEGKTAVGTLEDAQQTH